MSEVITKLFFKGLCMPLCIEYSIAQMSAEVFHGRTGPIGLIFIDSTAYIRLNFSDGIGYVDFEVSVDCKK